LAECRGICREVVGRRLGGWCESDRDMVTGYVCIFDDGTEGRASALPDLPAFQFGSDPPIDLDAHLMDVHGQIVNGAYLVVGQGSAAPIDNVGVLLHRGDPVPTIFEACHGRNAIYLEPDGTASWVPAWSNVVRYADKRTPTPARDYAHPYSPTFATDHWHGELVVLHGEADPWVLAESGLAPTGHTRILIRNRATGEVRIVWDTPLSFTSTPAQIAMTPLGPVVAINNPNDSMSYFRYPSHMKPWTPYAQPPVVTPPPTPEPQPQPEPEPVPVPVPTPEPIPTPEPPKPPKRKWWIPLIDALLTILRGGARP
jgi:hypothetical protein